MICEYILQYRRWFYHIWNIGFHYVDIILASCGLLIIQFELSFFIVLLSLYYVIVRLCVMNKNVFINLLRWPTVHLNSSSNNFMNIQQFHFIDDLK